MIGDSSTSCKQASSGARQSSRRRPRGASRRAGSEYQTHTHTHTPLRECLFPLSRSGYAGARCRESCGPSDSAPGAERIRSNPNSGRFSSDLAELGSTLGEVGVLFAKFSPSVAQACRHRREPGRDWPNSLPKFARHQPISARTWPKSVRFGQNRPK